MTTLLASKQWHTMVKMPARRLLAAKSVSAAQSFRSSSAIAGLSASAQHNAEGRKAMLLKDL
jgi:hypothetical protein